MSNENDERTFEDELKIGLYDQAPDFKGALINVHDSMWAARKMLVQHCRDTHDFTGADIVALTGIIMREIERMERPINGGGDD